MGLELLDDAEVIGSHL